MTKFSEMDIDELMRHYREILKLIREEHAYAQYSGTNFRRKKGIEKVLRKKEIDFEQCLTCEMPIRPSRVNENTCPECEGSFDVPENLKDNPNVEHKEEMLENSKKRESGWAIEDKIEASAEKVRLAKEKRQRQLESRLKGEKSIPTVITDRQVEKMSEQAENSLEKLLPLIFFEREAREHKVEDWGLYDLKDGYWEISEGYNDEKTKLTLSKSVPGFREWFSNQQFEDIPSTAKEFNRILQRLGNKAQKSNKELFGDDFNPLNLTFHGFRGECVRIFSGSYDQDCDGCGEPIEEGEKFEIHPEGITHKRCSKKFKMLKGLEKEEEEVEKDDLIPDCTKRHEPYETTPNDCSCKTLQDQKVERWKRNMDRFQE